MSVVKKKVILPTDNSEIDVQTDMQQQIIYKVADLAFEIQTPDAGRTRKLLDTFAPFEVQDADSLIFTFTGGAELVAPECRFGLYYKQWRNIPPLNFLLN